MLNLFLIVGFLAGFIISYFNIIPVKIESNTYNYILYILIFFVGAQVGGNLKIWKALRTLNIKVLLVPVATITGTFLGVIPLYFLLKDYNLKELIAVSAGFGYYSLSSIIISNLAGQTLGILTLISNLLREIFTIIFSPILVRIFGKLAPIVAGGATSMDTTLPSVINSSGKEYSIVSIFNGIVLTIIVPIILPLFFH